MNTNNLIRNPFNVIWENNLRIKLNGFSDLFLFRELNMLKSTKYIQVIGRKGINTDMNGKYIKQETLHCGKPWYLKIINDDNDHNKKNNHKTKIWVIRYYAPSESWLFDKRGLFADDIANGIGHGDVLSPLDVNKWEIHNG
eukprot:409547_1